MIEIGFYLFAAIVIVAPALYISYSPIHPELTWQGSVLRVVWSEPRRIWRGYKQDRYKVYSGGRRKYGRALNEAIDWRYGYSGRFF